MFTGLIESLGEIAEVKPTPGGLRLRLGHHRSRPSSRLATAWRSTASASPSSRRTADGIHADVSPETARVTTLGGGQRGALVNLERPLRADARLGGHFVQGHVDATGTIEELRQDGDSFWLTVKFPPALAPYIVPKARSRVDGVSLTVAGVDDRHFDVQIIPFTWEHTKLQHAQPAMPSTSSAISREVRRRALASSCAGSRRPASADST